MKNEIYYVDCYSRNQKTGKLDHVYSAGPYFSKKCAAKHIGNLYDEFFEQYDKLILISAEETLPF